MHLMRCAAAVVLLLAVLPGCDMVGDLTIPEGIVRDLPEWAAIFEPGRLTVPLDATETLRLRVSLATLGEVTVGANGGVSITDVQCEPATACTVVSGPEPGSGRLVLRVRDLKGLSIRVKAVAFGHASVWAQLTAPGGCDVTGFCSGGTKGERTVAIEVRP
jgi:hypothetical protein